MSNEVRLARALVELRRQVNDFAPHRATENDGWIGDRSHQQRHSDHNPNSSGVVCALDITHHPKLERQHFNCRKLWTALLASKDRRIAYLIYDGEICSGQHGPEPWIVRPYHGVNKHHEHLHVSVRQDPALYDDAKSWSILLTA